MDASSEKALMQKILKCVEAQAEVLKMIISHLSEIEEEEAKKDKANHGQSELTQEDINNMMTEGKVRLLLPNIIPQLKGALGPWTSKKVVSTTSLNWEMRDYGKIMISQNGPRSWE